MTKDNDERERRIKGMAKANVERERQRRASMTPEERHKEMLATLERIALELEEQRLRREMK